MTTTPKKTYWMQWMNKTRYKNDKGNLIIKITPHSSDEKKSREEFTQATKNGYACKLMSAELKMMDCINFSNNCKTEQREVEVNSQILEENDRWKLRMKEQKIQKLIREKESTELHMKEILDKLKKLNEE